MLQLLIFVTHRISASPLAWRILMIGVGSLAGAGFYLLCAQWVDRSAALWAGLFFATSPFLNEISVVPFQEILMVGFLCFALYSYATRRWILLTVFLTCACWTRYESWLICAVLAIDYVAQQPWKAKASTRAVLLFGIGPLSWIAVHHGLTPSGAYAIEFPRSPARLVRIVYLCWICIKQTSLPLLFCAGVCVRHAWLSRTLLRREWRLSLLFLTLYSIAILSAAHGVSHPGMPNPELFVSAREATLLVCFTLLLATFGFSRLSYKAWAPALGVLALIFGLLQSFLLVRSQANQPDVAVSYEVARYLTEHARRTDQVLFVAKPFVAEDSSYYIEQITRLGGSAGLAAARASLHEFDLSPMDYQRTAVQTNLPERNLTATADPRDVQWIVAWNNVPAPSSVSAALLSFEPVAAFERQTLRAIVWHRRPERR